MKNLNNYSKIKILFVGTPTFSAEHLKYLIKNRYFVIATLTQPDKFSGRNYIYSNNLIKNISLKNGIKIFQPISLMQKEFKEKIAKLSIDLLIVVAYGKIIPKWLLEKPRIGCINIHTSLLPRWRGPSPIQYAILYGDKKTGVTAIKMNLNIDEGDIICQQECIVEKKDNNLTLSNKLMQIGCKVMIKAIKIIVSKKFKLKKQNEKKVTYSKKINKNMSRLNWGLTAIYLDRLIRAFIPWPTSYFYIKDILFKVWEAEVIHNDHIKNNPGTIIISNKKGIQVATIKGIINLIRIQPANKKIMTVEEILNSRKNFFIPGNIIL